MVKLTHRIELNERRNITKLKKKKKKKKRERKKERRKELNLVFLFFLFFFLFFFSLFFLKRTRIVLNLKEEKTIAVGKIDGRQELWSGGDVDKVALLILVLEHVIVHESASERVPEDDVDFGQRLRPRVQREPPGVVGAGEQQLEHLGAVCRGAGERGGGKGGR